MQYGIMPRLMWVAFRGTFQRSLERELKVSPANTVMKKAHRDYRRILHEVNELGKGNRFVTNLLSCAMLSAVLLNVPSKPTVEQTRVFYRRAMTDNFLMRYAAKHSNAYTEKGRAALKQAAEKSRHSANPYDWQFTVEDGATLNQYTATFYTCGICHLMTKWGLTEFIPAMCTFDYDMAALNHTEFTRKFTLASGGPYCDCHYDHRG